MKYYLIRQNKNDYWDFDFIYSVNLLESSEIEIEIGNDISIANVFTNVETLHFTAYKWGLKDGDYSVLGIHTNE